MWARLWPALPASGRRQRAASPAGTLATFLVAGTSAATTVARVGARSGAQYLESIRQHQPEVWLGGQRVADVTTEPVFTGPLATIIEQYDLQLDPRHSEFAVTDGYSSSFLIPRTKEHLVRRRQTYKLRTDHTFGFMGRAPDFMNAIVTDFSLLADVFATGGSASYGDNVVAYYEHVRDNDLFLTHMLVNPQVDRSRPSSQQDGTQTPLLPPEVAHPSASLARTRTP